jgi:hypothetical protein
LTFPEPGDWVVALDTEYKDAAVLPPIFVVAPESPAPDQLPVAIRGMRLFIAKGCNGCHLHPDVKAGRIYGPDLAGRRFDPKYLRRFLADPSITPVPKKVCAKDESLCGSPYPMPNLNLKAAEIDALVVFLTGR